MLSIRKVAYTACITLLFVSLTASAKPLRKALTPFQDPSTELYGYKDTYGKVLIPPQFYYATPFSEFGIANVVLSFQKLDGQQEEKYFCRINTAGHIVEQAFFFDNGWDYYEEGLARYVWKGKVGFSNERGEHIIKACFDMAFPFINGVAPVCQGRVEKIWPNGDKDKYGCDCNSEYSGGQWGVVDKEGRILVPLVHEDAEAALKAFYFSDKAPKNLWMETTATITKVKDDCKAEKKWVYTFEPDNCRFASLQATSQKQLLKGQKIRIKYIMVESRAVEILGLVE